MPELKNKLIELEQHLLKEEIQCSKKELNRLLADDFMEIPSTGVPYLKVDALNRIPYELNPVFTQQDYQLIMLSSNVAQLVYKATIKRPDSTITNYSLRNSIWKNDGGKWQMIFHQGTPCEPFEISRADCINK